MKRTLLLGVLAAMILSSCSGGAWFPGDSGCNPNRKAHYARMSDHRVRW